ncbi:MAG: carbonic anhydrase [Methanoculleaceae archaeon]
MSSLDKFFEGNRRFIETDFSRDPDHYAGLIDKQTPTALFIGCSDSRVDPERVCGARMGEIFVHRNIGNIVPENDPNIATVLEYAVDHLAVEDVVVYGHSHCGAMKALDAGEGGEFIPGWLAHAREAREAADAQGYTANTPEEKERRLRFIEQENVRRQIDHLRSYRFISEAEKEGRITLSGLYYDIETGQLDRLC